MPNRAGLAVGTGRGLGWPIRIALPIVQGQLDGTGPAQGRALRQEGLDTLAFLMGTNRRDDRDQTLFAQAGQHRIERGGQHRANQAELLQEFLVVHLGVAAGEVEHPDEALGTIPFGMELGPFTKGQLEGIAHIGLVA